MRGLIFRVFSVAAALVIAFAMAVCVGSCRLVRSIGKGVVQCAEKIDPQQLYERLEKGVNRLGERQITGDEYLTGKRVCGDSYTGSYTAHCEGVTGREVIFGGASMAGRMLRISSEIETESGEAVLRIRMGNGTEEYPESAALTVDFDSGGCYVILLYDDFTGDITVTSEYAED